jgi:glycosyltransferase involved in cell wall biosynthesis
MGLMLTKNHSKLDADERKKQIKKDKRRLWKYICCHSKKQSYTTTYCDSSILSSSIAYNNTSDYPPYSNVSSDSLTQFDSGDVNPLCEQVHETEIYTSKIMYTTEKIPLSMNEIELKVNHGEEIIFQAPDLNYPHPKLYHLPIVTYINLDRSKDRRARTEQRLKNLHIDIGMDLLPQVHPSPLRTIKVCPGIQLNWPTALRFSAFDGKKDWFNVTQHLNIKSLTEEEWKEDKRCVVATTLSHLEALRLLLKHYPDQEWFLMLEDDTILEEEKWQRSIHTYLMEAYEECHFELIQLGTQGPQLLQLLQRNRDNKCLTVPWNKYYYGSYAYVITRQGIQKLVNTFYDEQNKQWSFSENNNTKPYDKKRNLAADFWFFNILRSFTSTIPWFTYEGLDSDIHEENLPLHRKNLVLMQQAYDNQHVHFFHSTTDYTSFTFLVNGYNNEKEVTRCLQSLNHQRYPKDKFRILYMDDASTDGTCCKLKQLQEKNNINNLTLLNHHEDTRKGAAYRRYQLLMYANQFRLHEKDEVIVFIDGDDRLNDDGVLDYLNMIYKYRGTSPLSSTSNDEVWMTLGGYTSSDGTRKDYGRWTKQQHDVGLRFSKKWYGSHLRTFKLHLFQYVMESHMKDDHGEWFTAATDVALLLPLIELCGWQHIYYTSVRKLYNYTIYPNQQYDPVRMELQNKNAQQIYNRKKDDILVSHI